MELAKLLVNEDQNWAKSLYRKAEELAEDSGDLRLLGDGYKQLFDDTEIAKQFYNKAEKKVKNANDYRLLAESIFKNLSDPALAKTVYKKAENKFDNYKDLIRIADSVCSIFGSNELAIELYKKAEIKAENRNDEYTDEFWRLGHQFRDLAESICEKIGDKGWAIENYKKWESITDNLKPPSCHAHIRLAVSLCEKLDDKEWARKNFEKAEKKAAESEDYCELSEKIIDHLGDREWVNNLLKTFKKNEIIKTPQKDLDDETGVGNKSFNQVELKFVFELETTLDNDKLWKDKCDEIYGGESWKECCDNATDNWDYDESIFPADEDGYVGDTAKTLQKIFQRSSLGKWEELTGELGSEIFDYYMKTWEEKAESSYPPSHSLSAPRSTKFFS